MRQQRFFPIFGILGFLVTAATAFARHQPPEVIPPENGSYETLAVEWWQWALSIPAPENPTLVTGRIDCLAGQENSDVIFLAGVFSSVVNNFGGKRKCTIPSGTPLFFPILNVDCSDVEAPPFHGDNEAERLACVEFDLLGDPPLTPDLQVVIDGVPIPDLDLYRAQSGDFPFTMPAQDNILGLPGVTGGTAVTDGYWLYLEPLSPGNHKVEIFGAFGATSPLSGFKSDVIYYLKVEE